LCALARDRECTCLSHRLDGFSEKLSHLVDERLGIERLFDEIVSPCGLALGSLIGLLLRRKQNHGGRWALGFDSRTEAVSSLTIQREIGKHDASSLRAELRECNVDALGCYDPDVLLPGKGHFQHLAHRDAVIDGQEGRRHGSFLQNGRATEVRSIVRKLSRWRDWFLVQ